jgi:hypothetical protein
MDFLVCEFGKLAISNLVKQAFGSEFPEIFSKRQVDYVYRYLNDLGAKSIVLESEYIDRDYLDDFAKYYVRRFNGNGHKCARLHFFAKEITHEEIIRLLMNCEAKEHDELRNSYLGYMVIKPLPKTFIGRMCLRVYEQLLSEQLLLRDYEVNFFGLKLSVKSVAFQEQDKVVSACATTAIWSALHAANWFPQELVPSCSKITTDAVNFISDSNNNFPNAQLTNKQMLRAIDVSGQRYYEHKLTDIPQEFALSIMENYLRSKIPLILGGDVYKLQSTELSSSDEKEYTSLGGHAITVTGFRFNSGAIDFFVHDDRLGPFVRTRVVATSDYVKKSKDEKCSEWSLAIQEKSDDGHWLDAKEVIVPDSIIAICPKKVRLPLPLCLRTCNKIIEMYENVIGEVEKYSDYFEREDNVIAKSSAVSYEINLTTVSDLKQAIMKSPVTKLSIESKNALAMSDFFTDMESLKLEILTKNMAKHQWSAQFYLEKEPAFIIFFDATEIAQGDAVSAVYPQDTLSLLVIASGVKKIVGILKKKNKEVKKEYFINSFLRKVSLNPKGLSDHLDKTYGQPRAPLRLKLQEVTGSEIARNPTVQTYYEATESTLEDIFSDLVVDSSKNKIWVIDIDGTLLIGDEAGELGHPTLTDFRPARISGEIRFDAGKWRINSKSGRYSGNYSNRNELLENAVARFKSIFYFSRDSLKSDPWEEEIDR